MKLGRQIAAWIAAAALVIGTVYAPLFHVHAESGEAPLVHAHFPELEVPEDETVVHMERPHSHAAARSVDVLVTVASAFVHFDAAIQSSSFDGIELQPSRGFTPAAAPRAHAPPAVADLIPRAPPA